MKQKTLIPLDFKVTPEIRLLAKVKGWPDPDEQREKFIDWHRARGRKFYDFEAAFRGWLRYALEHGLAGPCPRPTPGLIKAEDNGEGAKTLKERAAMAGRISKLVDDIVKKKGMT